MSDKGSRKADLWQRKYYDSLEELEQKEKQWEELESLLRLLASRLTLLSDSQDEQLEKKLDKLRSNLRYEDNALKFRPLINDITSAIAKSDAEIKPKKSSTEFDSANSLNDLLDELKIPSVFQRQERHVRKRIGRAKSNKDIPDLVKDIAELLGLTIEHLAEQKQEEILPQISGRTEHEQTDETVEKTGFIKKLFSNEKNNEIKSASAQPTYKKEWPENTPSIKPPTIESASENIEPALETITEVDVKADSGKKSNNDTHEILAEEICFAAGILIELLQQLELPHDLCVEAGLIRQRLQPCYEHEQLVQGLEATVALVADAHDRIYNEKKELEAFLQQLTERLQEIDTDLQETVRLQQLSVSGSRQVNAAVEEEVRGIEQSVEKAADLAMLQTDVQARVIIIRDHMDRFLQTELTRDKQVAGISEHLKKELSAAEDEIETLRQQLEAEREQSMQDALTGLYNRKAYDQYINDELARFKRYGSAFVIAVWDVDLFKSVNDTYGHVAGDKVLKIIARVIADNTRETDIVARYGGEEFVVIMPETKIAAAYKSQDKLRKTIQSCAFHFRESHVEITASCGLTEVCENDTPESIFQRADSGLYKAKENGRNRCEMVS